MRFMIAGLLAVSLLGAPSPGLSQEDRRVAAALARLPAWRTSVVTIRITCGDGNRYEGVGVVVKGTGEVLSAAHVGSHCLEVHKAAIGIVRSPYASPGDDLTATLKARIADDRTSFDQEAARKIDFQDLALWKIDDMRGSGLTPVKIAKRFPIAGDPIEIVGFSNLPFLHTRNGNAGLNSGTGITRYRTWISSVGGTAGSNLPYRIHYAGFTLPGLSGGPVFNRRGELIGIHAGRYAKPIDNALYSGCDTSKPNCVAVRAQDGTGATTIGVNTDALKTMLDNYSWATSVFAIPAGWLR